jgi:hypothetical protein
MVSSKTSTRIKYARMMTGLILILSSIPMSFLILFGWGFYDMIDLIISGFNKDIVWARFPWAIFKMIISVPISFVVGMAMFGGGLVLSGLMENRISILQRRD